MVSFTYDSGTEAVGRLSSFSDQAGTGSYTYYVLGRIASEQRTITGSPNITKNMSYTYNAAGTVKSVAYPSGATVAYKPDAAGRILSALDTGNNINYVKNGTYGPDGQLTGFLSGQTVSFAGISNSFSFNKRLQPMNMAAASPSATIFNINYDFHVGVGDNGNVWAITNNKDTTRNQGFAYDALNRLTSAQNGGTDCTKTTVNGKTEYWGNSYSYDAWGNLLGKSVTKCSAENLAVTAAANNQLLGGYTYDAAGNMTWDQTDLVTAVYDAENRIATATKNGATTSYIYDARGDRVKKSNGGSPPTGTLYWYMTPGIVGESDLAGNLKTEYVFFGGKRIARRDLSASTVSYYFSDHLNTASVVTDATGTILDESDYYPWGGELQFINNLDNHYKFTGKERDTETGLDLMGARYYSSSLGRFAKADPLPWIKWQNGNNKAQQRFQQYIGNPQNFNQYAYALNSPARFSDPTGLYICSGDKQQCQAVENSLNAVKRAADQLSKGSKEEQALSKKLGAISDFYGKAGVDNGVKVQFARLDPGTTGKTEHEGVFFKTTTITFDYHAFSHSYVDGAETVAHEGEHGLAGPTEKTWLGFSKWSSVLGQETQAYQAEAAVDRGLGMQGSSWDPTGRLKSEDLINGNAVRNAHANCRGLCDGEPPNF